MTWKGSQEKKWEWYKHTKPCNNIINSGFCNTPNCNYAHTLEQYTAAIQKRHFDIDFNIIEQLANIISEPSPKRQRRN
jgi:hypothetical protein